MSRRSGATSVDAKEEPPRSNKTQEDQKKLLATDTGGHFSIIKALHLADLITEMNGLCGFMSILSSMRFTRGTPDDYTNVWLALGFMPFGLFFDFFDGKVARWRHKSSLMGQELDSLADLISFGVSPAAVGFAIGFQTLVDQLLLAFFVLCGLTRLARFNVTVALLPKDKTGKSKYFEGIPIPFACLTIASIMAFWVSQGWILDQVPGGVVLQGTPLEMHPSAALFALNGCLMRLLLDNRALDLPT